MENKIDLYNFAKDYVVIKSPDNDKQISLSEQQLRIIKYVQEGLNKGYHPELIETRYGTKIKWFKDEKSDFNK